MTALESQRQYDKRNFGMQLLVAVSSGLILAFSIYLGTEIEGTSEKVGLLSQELKFYYIITTENKADIDDLRNRDNAAAEKALSTSLINRSLIHKMSGRYDLINEKLMKWDNRLTDHFTVDEHP